MVIFLERHRQSGQGHATHCFLSPGIQSKDIFSCTCHWRNSYKLAQIYSTLITNTRLWSQDSFSWLYHWRDAYNLGKVILHTRCKPKNPIQGCLRMNMSLARRLSHTTHPSQAQDLAWEYFLATPVTHTRGEKKRRSIYWKNWETDFGPLREN